MSGIRRALLSFGLASNYVVCTTWRNEMLRELWLCGATPTWREHLITGGNAGPNFTCPTAVTVTHQRNDYEGLRHSPA